MLCFSLMKRKNIFVVSSVYDALENPKHKYFRIFNRFLSSLTLASVVAVVLETVPSFSPYQYWLLSFEYIAVGIFSLEYLTRLVGAKSRTKYVFSFFGLADLLAIIPTFLGLGNLTFLKAARSVRTIRLLRLLRLAKVARFKDEKEGARSVLGINFEIYIVAFLMALLFLGSLFYLFENTTEVEGIHQGMYWSLQIILGGMPVAQPETFGGTFTFILARFTSMILLGIVIGLIGTILRRILIGADKDVN